MNSSDSRLVDREGDNVDDLNMSRSRGNIDDVVRDISTNERGQASVHRIGLGLILEANDRELGLNHAGRNESDSDGSRDELMSQASVDSLDHVLGSAVDGSIGVGVLASDRTDRNDMSRVPLDHAGDERLDHLDNSLDVGVNHRVHVLPVHLVDGARLLGQASVVHQNVDIVAQLGGQALVEGVDLLRILNVQLGDGDLNSVLLLDVRFELFQNFQTTSRQNLGKGTFVSYFAARM